VALCAETAALSHERRPTPPVVNFSLIVAARPSNASKKLTSAVLGGLAERLRERSRPRRSGPKRDFFLAKEKK
jgi:hypothetical protein